jgi:hypothetical protein
MVENKWIPMIFIYFAALFLVLLKLWQLEAFNLVNALKSMASLSIFFC